MKFDVFYKYGNIFRSIIDIRNIEWCDAMDGKESNQITQAMINLTKDSIPDFFHSCPIKVS